MKRTLTAICLFAGVALAAPAMSQETCIAFTNNKLQNISYAARAQAAQLDDLAAEQREISAGAQNLRQIVRALEGEETPEFLVAAAYALDAGQKLQATLAGGSDDPAGLRATYEQHRTTFWNAFNSARRAVLAAAASSQGASASRRAQSVGAVERLSDARQRLHELEEIERQARLALDTLPADSPERAQAQSAYYQALVDQLPAQQALRGLTPAVGVDMIMDMNIYFAARLSCRPNR